MVTKAELVREKSEPPARISWGAWVCVLWRGAGGGFNEGRKKSKEISTIWV
jgi:hypothetical protein